MPLMDDSRKIASKFGEKWEACLVPLRLILGESNVFALIVALDLSLEKVPLGNTSVRIPQIP